MTEIVSGADHLPATAPGRVGLVGGSFNPAHSGHLHISQLALDILGLDTVWWLVSPQNPLKSADDMGPLADRVSEARALAAPEMSPNRLAPFYLANIFGNPFDTSIAVARSRFDSVASLRFITCNLRHLSVVCSVQSG